MRDSGYNVSLDYLRSFVTFPQYALLGQNLNPVIKAAIVGVVRIGASWATAKVLLMLPGAAQVL